MKKKMTLRFILLALGGLALGGAITYLWWPRPPFPTWPFSQASA